MVGNVTAVPCGYFDAPPPEIMVTLLFARIRWLANFHAMTWLMPSSMTAGAAAEPYSPIAETPMVRLLNPPVWTPTTAISILPARPS